MDIKKITINETYVDKLIETNDITKEDLIIFTEDVYTKNFFTATKIGRRHILAKIVDQSYGEKHISFTLSVIECIGANAEEILNKKEIRRREKTIFKFKVYRQLWNNELNRCYLLDNQFLYKEQLSNTVQLA